MEITNPAERILSGLIEAGEKKKREIEASVRECDGILGKIRSTREILANPDKTDFETIKNATEKLVSLKADLAERKKAISKELQGVNDQDFKDLINFHFCRVDK